MVLRYLEKLDFLSKSPSINFKGKSRIKSVFGGALTFLFCCFSVLITVYIGRDLVFRETPTLVFETKENLEYKVSLTDYPIALQFRDFFGRDLGSEESFMKSIEVYVEINHIEKKEVYSGYFPIKKCDSSFLKPDFLSKLREIKREGEMFCPDFRKAFDSRGEEFEGGNYIKRGFGEPDSSFLSIAILTCNKTNPDCTQYEHQYGVYYAAVLSYDSFTEATNYTNPVKNRLNTTIGQITKSFYTRQYAEIDYNILKTDSGWLFTSETVEEHYSLGSKSFEIADYSEKARALYQFTFSAPSKEQIIRRKYIKIPEIIAFVGGFAKGLLIGFKFVLDLYTNYWLKVEAVRLLKKKSHILVNTSQPSTKSQNREQESVSESPAKISHLSQFLASLFSSSHKLNLEYKETTKYLDFFTLIRTGELVNDSRRTADINQV